jgi:peroxiredoxin
MRKFLLAGLASVTLALTAATASAEVKIGQAAPAFAGVDSTGKTVKLEDYRGKTVVLEWTNHECPFVKKHYNSGNMQSLQKKWTEQGVVWLSVISSPPGEQGNVPPEKANQLTQERNAAPSAVLIDPKGEIARLYEAKTTPHMYVVTPQGQLAYMGGIDDKPSTKVEDVKTATNYVDAALAEVIAGQAVSTPATRAYGCTVKYAS